MEEEKIRKDILDFFLSVDRQSILALRVRYGLSQRDIADASGMSQHVIFRLEHRFPRVYFDNLQKYIRAVIDAWRAGRGKQKEEEKK